MQIVSNDNTKSADLDDLCNEEIGPPKGKRRMSVDAIQLEIYNQQICIYSFKIPIYHCNSMKLHVNARAIRCSNTTVANCQRAARGETECVVSEKFAEISKMLKTYQCGILDASIALPAVNDSFCVRKTRQYQHVSSNISS